MHYTQLFRTLRETNGLTLDTLAGMARCHRNTIVNIESGRPVKFKTIVRLMKKMGYDLQSTEMKGLALLWLEGMTRISLSQPGVDTAARAFIAEHRQSTVAATQQLNDAIAFAGLLPAQIELLTFAASTPEALSILETVRNLSQRLVSKNEEVEDLQVAEDPSPDL